MNKKKIKWNQLPWWLQTEIIIGGVWIGWLAISFIIGFIVGIIELI